LDSEIMLERIVDEGCKDLLPRAWFFDLEELQ